MLYVDGMNGVIAHNETIQWLYQLTSSKVSCIPQNLQILMLPPDYRQDPLHETEIFPKQISLEILNSALCLIKKYCLSNLHIKYTCYYKQKYKDDKVNKSAIGLCENIPYQFVSLLAH